MKSSLRYKALYSRVIELFAERQNISLDEALHDFYESELYQLNKSGISDMHCMSEAYLAEDLEWEFLQKKITIKR